MSFTSSIVAFRFLLVLVTVNFFVLFGVNFTLHNASSTLDLSEVCRVTTGLMNLMKANRGFPVGEEFIPLHPHTILSE